MAEFGQLQGSLRQNSGENVRIDLQCHKVAIIYGVRGEFAGLCSKEHRTMRKIILAAAAGAAALTLSACSEKTEDAAAETADAAMADAEANADAAGEEIDADAMLARLVHGGYRREEVVEHRGEVARRGSIIDVFPSTADTPIRIDLWGDEVDRLTQFNVNDQRSTDAIEVATIFPARELQITDEVKDMARSLVATEAWGREHWDRLSDGANFDGMESWLPWLITEELLLTDILPKDSELLLVDPKRMRTRAHDLLAEEDDLARALAYTWARDADKSFPRLNA